MIERSGFGRDGGKVRTALGCVAQSDVLAQQAQLARTRAAELFDTPELHSRVEMDGFLTVCVVFAEILWT